MVPWSRRTKATALEPSGRARHVVAVLNTAKEVLNTSSLSNRRAAGG